MAKYKKYGLIANRLKGETSLQYNMRVYQERISEWIRQKKEKGEWLPKDEYERKTQKPGKRD